MFDYLLLKNPKKIPVVYDLYLPELNMQKFSCEYSREIRTP